MAIPFQKQLDHYLFTIQSNKIKKRPTLGDQ